jgi:predicted nucleic acid-binding protein
MKLALDTNRYVDLMQSMPDVVAVVESADEVVLPFVVLAELRAGFAHGTRRKHNEQTLIRFLQTNAVTAAYADEQTVSYYADIYADMRKRARMIPHNDLWISALCLQHGLTLFTRDKHFDSVPQIARL